MGNEISAKRLLLWVDDDAPQRFLFEEHVLRKAGWNVRWAVSVLETMTKLESDAFEAVLLDQMLPFGLPNAGSVEAADVWSGCRLLHWLRGRSQPSTAPPLRDGEAGLFDARRPRAENVKAVTLIVSAFFDEEIESAISSVPNVQPLFSKPIDMRLLLSALSGGTG